jgi:uncharacterized protein
MDALALIARHYAATPDLHRLLVVHSVLVTQKALAIARDYLEAHPGAAIDLELLTEASLLHDIGIKHCDAPELLCHGTEPYIRHGLLGRQMLEAEGLPRHALFCVRHTGSGIPREEVRAQALPLPDDDYLPVSLEEKILCIADKHYSKSPAKLWREKKRGKIEKGLAKHGEAALERWRALCQEILEE